MVLHSLMHNVLHKQTEVSFLFCSHMHCSYPRQMVCVPISHTESEVKKFTMYICLHMLFIYQREHQLTGQPSNHFL